MTSTCQNCQKEYQPKRRGGKFCSTACRVSAWEKAQELGEKVSDELYLARKLEALMKGADELLARVRGLPEQEAGQEFRRYLLAIGWGMGNGVVERILKAEQPAGQQAGEN